MNENQSIADTSKNDSGNEDPAAAPEDFAILSIEDLAGVTGGAIEIVETRDA